MNKQIERLKYSVMLGIGAFMFCVFVYNILSGGAWIGPFAECAQNKEKIYISSLAKLQIVNQSEIIDYKKTNKIFGSRSLEVTLINERINFLSEISKQLESEGWKPESYEEENYSTHQKEETRFIVKKIGLNKYSILIE